MHAKLDNLHSSWTAWPALRSARWTTGGGGQGYRRRDTGWSGQVGRGHTIIDGKTPSEGAKASEQGKGRSFGYTGIRRQGIAGIPSKIVEGDIGG